MEFLVSGSAAEEKQRCDAFAISQFDYRACGDDEPSSNSDIDGSSSQCAGCG
jgi:hypothetical protein